MKESVGVGFERGGEEGKMKQNLQQSTFRGSPLRLRI